MGHHKSRPARAVYNGYDPLLLYFFALNHDEGLSVIGRFNAQVELVANPIPLFFVGESNQLGARFGHDVQTVPPAVEHGRAVHARLFRVNAQAILTVIGIGQVERALAVGQRHFVGTHRGEGFFPARLVDVLETPHMKVPLLPVKRQLYGRQVRGRFITAVHGGHVYLDNLPFGSGRGNNAQHDRVRERPGCGHVGHGAPPDFEHAHAGDRLERHGRARARSKGILKHGPALRVRERFAQGIQVLVEGILIAEVIAGPGVA